MPHEFDQREADQRHKELLNRVDRVYNLIENEILEYYDNDFPESERDERETREDIRRYLIYAYNDIDDILDDLDRELGY
jgi:hypothetical protein